MKISLNYSASIVILIFTISCANVNLNGHYHLEWENNDQFQVWNIKNNKMVINRANCIENDSNCFSSQLIFKGNKIHINPWVDINISYNYEIDKNGTLKLFIEYPKLLQRTKCKRNCGFCAKFKVCIFEQSLVRT